jgi:hypothetical protein
MSKEKASVPEIVTCLLERCTLARYKLSGSIVLNALATA